MDFTNPPAGLAQWMICLGCALWIARSVLQFFREVRGPAPHPPNQVLEQSDKELSRRAGNLEIKGEEKISQVYQRIEAVRVELTNKVDAMNEKFEELPDRILNMLRNVQDLGRKN
jgi:hypothetical protein